MIDAYEDPGVPDRRGGARYLWWLVRQQAGRSALGSLISCVWMVLLAATPYTLTIDASGLKLVEKGRRNGQEVSWKQILASSPPAQ